MRRKGKRKLTEQVVHIAVVDHKLQNCVIKAAVAAAATLTKKKREDENNRLHIQVEYFEFKMFLFLTSGSFDIIFDNWPL